MIYQIGLPLLLPITQQAVIVPAALIGTIIVSQYLLTSSVYFDEYDGEVYEKQWEWWFVTVF